MFEFIDSISLNVPGGSARGRAIVPGDHPFFADHFPGTPLLPGSLLIEFAAQVAGPLAEQLIAERLNIERWALLGMVREARFLRPVALPATIFFNAELTRFESTNVTLIVEAREREQTVMRAELVMMMIEAAPDWDVAIRDRHQRLASWKGTA